MRGAHLHLILDVHCRGAGALHLLHTALDVERRAETRVDVDQQRQPRDACDATHVGENCVYKFRCVVWGVEWGLSVGIVLG